ncbi:MAG: hypothetical protein GY856_09180 [bacterium]|nr:hypothetical protein [bacterium]
MRKVMIVGLAVLAVMVVLGLWWLRGTRVELAWDSEWPETLRVTGEAVEPLTADAGGETSEGDRARAVERARWKAYYYAQLRAAERLGGLEISSQTTISNLALTDQELKSSYTSTVQAAQEIPSAGSVEYLEDAVLARVVVEIPPERLMSFKTVILRALRSGRISLEPRARPSPPDPPPAPLETPAGQELAEAPAADGNGDADASPEAAPSAEGDATVTVTATAGARPARFVLPPAPRPEHTGAALYLLQKAGIVGAAPVIYDAAGSELGSIFDLPPDRIAAGLPVASAGDEEAIRRWAGSSPRGFEVTVSQGNLFLTDKLAPQEVLAFREWLRTGRIVLILGHPGE